MRRLSKRNGTEEKLPGKFSHLASSSRRDRDLSNRRRRVVTVSPLSAMPQPSSGTSSWAMFPKPGRNNNHFHIGKSPVSNGRRDQEEKP